MYHKNLDATRQILSKYKVRDAVPEDTISDMRVPRFLLSPNFDATKNLEPQFSHSIQESIIQDISKNKKTQENLKFMDKLFDYITYTCLVIHVLLYFVAFRYKLLPHWFLILAFVLLRTSVSGAGHYQIHRSTKDNWFAGFFDINYVGVCFLALDGHTQLHHPHTRFGADVKISFFNAPKTLPRLWRIPIHTAHMFGRLISGITIRLFTFMYELSQFIPLKHLMQIIISVLAFRVYLLIELLAIIHDKELILVWILQFALTIWWNNCLIVSSHELEERYEEPKQGRTLDFSQFQVEHAYDIFITGNKYIDCFVSAGLSPHRVHHTLPFQKSGFANIASTELVKQACENKNVKWEKEYNFWTERLPAVVQDFFMTRCPTAAPEFIGENFSVDAAVRCVMHVIGGFAGHGVL